MAPVTRKSEDPPGLRFFHFGPFSRLTVGFAPAGQMADIGRHFAT